MKIFACRFKLFLFVAVLTVAFAGVAAEAVKPVKYLFLFIGDGLSIPQRTIAEEYFKRTENRGLAINALPVQGINTTSAANQFITDSAAAGTAIACGVKTKNGSLGVDLQGNRIESIAELAKKYACRVGIISSVGLNHATPAAFYSHNASRGNYYTISLELIDSGFDFFGGGRLIDEDGPKAKSGEKQENAHALAAKKGFTVIEGKPAFAALTADKLPVLAVTVRETGNSLPNAIDGDGGEPTLADYVAKAIELLKSDDGFFIMAEGGKIDWLCHANDAAAMMHEIAAFDDAVKVAIRFAEAHPDETLIVVTGDHETGGLTLGFAGTAYNSYLELLKHQTVSGEQFNRQFQALKKEKGDKLIFDDVKPMLASGYGFQFDAADKKEPMLLSPLEAERLKVAFDRAMGGKDYAPTENPKVLYGGYNPLVVAASHIIANKAAVGWTSFAHTAMPVGTSALGVNAEAFTGMYDNTDIAKRLKAIITAKPPKP
jgi:alkaline phosphatase